jgi:hypothetical protein
METWKRPMATGCAWALDCDTGRVTRFDASAATAAEANQIAFRNAIRHCEVLHLFTNHAMQRFVALSSDAAAAAGISAAFYAGVE